MSTEFDSGTENRADDIPTATVISVSEREDESRLSDVGFADVAPALEFACWVVVVLAPLLRWVNGAAVTDDQFYIQCAIVALAVVGAVSLRFYNWRQDQSQRE